MKQSILAVDDEPHMLKLLERIITEKTSFTITTTSNSLEIPNILEQNQFELIVTDLMMPGMDGMDILRYVRENKRPEVVVIMTAFGSLDSAVDALQLGVFDYITKPFKKEQIIFTIDRAMQWQAIRQESTRMSKIFDAEPFKTAHAAFEREYVRRLAERTGMDTGKMVQQSGLTAELINSILEEK